MTDRLTRWACIAGLYMAFTIFVIHGVRSDVRRYLRRMNAHRV